MRGRSFLHNKQKILWITRTAGLVGMLIAFQMATVSFGNIVITGSIVNLMLIVSVMTCGFASGLSVAVISPVVAKFFGIGAFWVFIPFIAAGNIALIWFWHFVGNINMGRKYTAYVVALVCAAIAKFLVLYIGIVRIAAPVFLRLPGQQAAVISYTFSILQLINTSIGGMLAIGLLPTLKNILER